METLLDEATAELGKLEFSPMLATIEISFRIVKAVPLHTTLRVDCEVHVSFHCTDAQIHTQAQAKALPALRAACVWRCVYGGCCIVPAMTLLLPAWLLSVGGPKDLPTALHLPCRRSSCTS